MKVRKEIIRPGVYTYIHPATGLPEKYLATPDRIRYLHDQGKAMHAAGLAVPVPLEHQADAHPLTQAERAAHQLKNNAGWVEDYELGEVKEKGPDGKELVVKDVLFGHLDIQDAEIAKKLPKTIRFTSPWINSFTAGDGKRYDGVISHVALTTRPRIAKQQPFAESMAAALSLLGSLSQRQLSSIPAEGVEISRAGLLRDAAGGFKPQYPVAFSLYTGIKLGGSDELRGTNKGGQIRAIWAKDPHGDYHPDADHKPTGRRRKKKKGKRFSIMFARDDDDDEYDYEDESDEKEDGAEYEYEYEEEERQSPLDEVTQDNGSDVKIHEMIAHLLKALGFNPPEGMDETTFERDLYETLMAKVHEMGAKARAPAPTEPEKLADDNPGPTNPIIQESPTMYASLAEVKAAIPDARIAMSLWNLQQENAKNKARAEAAAKNILDDARGKRQARVEKIAARFPVAKRDKFLAWAAAPSAALSLEDDGKVKDPMATALEMIESAALDIPSLLRDPTSAREQEHPAGDVGDGIMSEERRQQVLQEFQRNAGRAAPVLAGERGK